MRFFNWFFVFINIGSLLAVTVLIYKQDHVGRKYGYGICVVAILVGLMVFSSGTRRYRFKTLEGSPLTQIAAVVLAAWAKRKLELPSDLSELYDVNKELRKKEKSMGRWRGSTIAKTSDTDSYRIIVAESVIDDTCPASLCHHTRLDNRCYKITVQTVLAKSFDLPYPTEELRTIGDTVRTFRVSS